MVPKLSYLFFTFSIFLLQLFKFLAKCDLFTSVADLQRLTDVEKEIPDLINQYIQLETQRLEHLRSYAENYRSGNEELQTNIESVSNPVNAFLMIKRLSSTWRDLQEKMKTDFASEYLNNITMNGYTRFPSEEDLNGAAVGLLRLQDTYRLETTDLANGIVQGIKTRKPLTAFDCFEIGRIAYNEQDFYHTLLWMEEALDRSKKEDPPTISESEILEYLAFAQYKQGNLKRALLTTDRLYKIFPQHPRAKGNIQWYEDQLAADGVKPADYRRQVPPLQNKRPGDFMTDSERQLYEALCRGEVPVSPKELSKLYCYYKMDRPYLRLAPFKVEILRFNPLAVMFRNVISDDEIERIKELAVPKLARATVQNAVTGKLETANYRISKSAWLKGTDDEVVDRVNRRMHLMTNLEMATAEELQIANYGIGGHYDAHYDFARKEETKAFQDLGTGNRIATVLFYMSRPEKAGYTVFTELKTSVPPSMHDALFWYNLCLTVKETFEQDMISNKWIHEKGQEFYRPCALKPSFQERYVGDQGAPEPRYTWNIRQY